MARQLTGRATQRVRHSRHVDYRSAAGLVADYRENLRRGRLFVNTRRPLPVGARVGLVLRLDPVRLRLSAQGRVVRMWPFGNELNDSPGMEVLLDLGCPGELHRIVRALRRERHPA